MSMGLMHFVSWSREEKLTKSRGGNQPSSKAVEHLAPLYDAIIFSKHDGTCGMWS